VFVKIKVAKVKSFDKIVCNYQAVRYEFIWFERLFIPKPTWAVGFVLEQPLCVVAIA
jgi:hypothetical protein